MAYAAESVAVEPIREDQKYGGQRVTLQAKLHGARIPLQIDVGHGDAVTPGATWVEIPVLLSGMESPRLRAYPVYTVVAEKLEAMVQLGAANSRMKDFYDLDFLLGKFELEAGLLREAAQRTFARRGTPMPAREPDAFGIEFARHKQAQWQQFLVRSNLKGADLDLEKVLDRIRTRLLSVVLEVKKDAAAGEPFPG